MSRVLLSVGLALGASAIITGCGGGGGSSAPTTEIDKIAEAKALLEELRTQALSVVDYNGTGNAGYLDTEALDLDAALHECEIDAAGAADNIGKYIDDMTVSEVWDDGSIFTRTCQATTNGTNCTYEHSRGTQHYAGNFFIPDSENKSLEMYHAEFHGTVPFSDYTASQTFDADIVLTQQDDGARLELTSMTLDANDTQIGISDLVVTKVGGVWHEFQEGEYVRLDSVTLNAECRNYQTAGTIKSYDYVENAYLADGGNENYIPSKLTFEGSITNTDTQGKISGMITTVLKNAATIENNETDPEVEIAVEGTLAMPSRPKMDLEMGYHNTVADTESYHHFTSDYSHDDVEIHLTGTLDKEGENGTIVVTSNKGITYTVVIVAGEVVEGDAEAGTGSLVEHSGTIIGTLEYRDEMIIVKYTDGSFESLI